MFAFGKYFGITELSTTDKANIAEGKDSVVSLFYVCCSGAVQSLAVAMFVPMSGQHVMRSLPKAFFSIRNIIGEEAL